MWRYYNKAQLIFGAHKAYSEDSPTALCDSQLTCKTFQIFDNLQAC